MRVLKGVIVLLLTQSLLLAGCGSPPQAMPKVGGPKIQGVIGEGPVSEIDLPIVEKQILGDFQIAADSKRDFKIIQTVHTNKVSYILYKMPNNDGLAIVSKKGPNIKVLERIPIMQGDPRVNLVTYNTIVAGNPWDPDNGVLFGTVHNPYIKSIEAAFRDTTKVKTDVSQSRGYIFVRPGTDTRFVQINAYGDGGLFWTQDTR